MRRNLSNSYRTWSHERLDGADFSNLDTSKMNSSELRELARSLMKQAEEQSRKEFESTMNFLSDKLAHMGKTKKDAVIHLVKMMRSAEEKQTLAELADILGSAPPTN